ncbi:hypothetical protein LG314_05230 [Agrococcus terreus]|uniref:hypothetical protein n=1 Tax=Agrococcus terreus TaxID=574649 RepID=UPI00384FE0EF
MTRRERISCAPGAAARVVQGTVAMLLLAFAIDSLPDLAISLIAGSVGTALAVGAVRGWCPGSLLQRFAAQR